MKPAPILSPSFRWIAASTHTDPSLFAARQRERMIAAQRQRVIPLKQKERK